MRNLLATGALAAILLAPVGAFAAGNAPVSDRPANTITPVFETCADGTQSVYGYKLTSYAIVNGVWGGRNSQVDYRGKSPFAIARSFWCKYYTGDVTPELVERGLVYPN